MANLNITNIPAPRVPFIDERTGLMAREWYRFFLNLFVLTGSGNNPVSLEELQIGPPSQQDFTDLLIQINQNIAPQYEDQSGDFLATLDTAQLMSMMSRFENAEAAIQGAYLQPVVQTGTIANYNLDGSPTAGGIAYGTGPALAVSAAGSSGQVLTSAAAGTPTWTTPTTGTVTAVSVVSANGLAGTSSGGATPALTLSTTVTGVVKGNGTALSAAVAATDYVAPSAYASANGLTMATARLLGRTTASTGAAEEISVAGGLTLSAGTLTGASGTVTSVAALTLGTTGTDLTSTVANGTTTPVITLQVPTASASNRGALSSTDWSTFNSKGSGSVTSVAQSFTGGLISVAGSPITTSGTLALTVAGTSGGIPYFSSASTWASSAALAAGSLVLGGGAGVTPATTATGTGVVTALGVNTGTAGAFVVNGGALGTPSSGTVTNLTGTASININGTVGATTANTGLFTTVGTTGLLTANINGGTLPAGVSAESVRTAGANGSTNRMLLDGFGGVSAITFRRANTSSAAPSAVQSGDNLAFLSVLGYGATAYNGNISAAFAAQAAENWTDSAIGSKWIIQAAPIGGTTRTTIAEFSSGATALTGTASSTGVLSTSDTTDASSTTAAALKTAGGLAVVKKAVIGAGIGISGTAAGAGGLAFPATAVAVADVNTLDDYEEGTWTPAPNIGTFSSATGRYTKVGQQVTLTFDITVGTGGGTTMTAPISSAITTANSIYTDGQVFGVGTTSPMVVIGGGGAAIYFRSVGSAVAFSTMTLTASATIIGTLVYFV